MDTSPPLDEQVPTVACDPSPPVAPAVTTDGAARSADVNPSVRTSAAAAEAAIDNALIARFRGGDEGAFTEIVSRYRTKIHALAAQFLRNHADAEEIAQDTFIRAHRGLAQFRGDASFATWLHRITVNLARNRYWYFFRRRRHMALSLDAPLNADTTGSFSELVAAPDPDPVRQATFEEFSAMVSVCMDKLEPRDRDILDLRNLLHRSYIEIADTLGINEGTVKSRIARARGRLRGLIVESCPEFSLEGSAADWFEPSRGCSRLA